MGLSINTESLNGDGGRELAMDSSEGLTGIEKSELKTEDIEYGCGRRDGAEMAMPCVYVGSSYCHVYVGACGRYATDIKVTGKIIVFYV